MCGQPLTWAVCSATRYQACVLVWLMMLVLSHTAISSSIPMSVVILTRTFTAGRFNELFWVLSWQPLPYHHLLWFLQYIFWVIYWIICLGFCICWDSWDWVKCVEIVLPNYNPELMTPWMLFDCFLWNRTIQAINCRIPEHCHQKVITPLLKIT